jgi:hypothetical protein
MMKHLKGYKGFKQGLICRDKQYKENTVFEEDKAIVCSKGMHFCTNPLDVLDYYDLVNEDGTFSEYTEVEALADSVTDDNKKYCTTKLKIGVKLGFAGFIKACVNFLIEKTSFQQDDINSGDFAKIGSSGDSAKIGSSGDFAKIGSSGDFAKITSKGKHSVVMAAGCDSRVKAKIGSWITLVEWVRTDEQTEKGYAIWIPKCVRTEYVDGEHIKEDTFYRLKDGEFVEC